jgi:hypothetical protein
MWHSFRHNQNPLVIIDFQSRVKEWKSNFRKCAEHDCIEFQVHTHIKQNVFFNSLKTSYWCIFMNYLIKHNIKG